MAEGRLHVYSGDGKGKTTTAVGLVVRMLGNGGKVAFVQFDKSEEGFPSGERNILKSYERCFFAATGKSRFSAEEGKFRTMSDEEDVKEALRGLAILKKTVAEGDYDLVVADEICTAVLTHLLKEDDVMMVVDEWERRGRRCELVFTGRGAFKKLIDRADLVTEMKNVKHYFDMGEEARKGIEY